MDNPDYPLLDSQLRALIGDEGDALGVSDRGEYGNQETGRHN